MFEWGTSLIRRYIFLLSFIYWFRPEASGTDQISQKYTDSCYTKIALGKVICNPESGKFLRVESGILGLEFLIQLKEYGFPLTTGIRIPSSTDKESVACSRLNDSGATDRKRREKNRVRFSLVYTDPEPGTG